MGFYGDIGLLKLSVRVSENKTRFKPGTSKKQFYMHYYTGCCVSGYNNILLETYYTIVSNGRQLLK
jgi:hypothetical protein